MFAGLSSDLILYFLAISMAAAFFVGNAMNAVLGEQGFGVFGNMIVLSVGFFAGLFVVDLVPFGRIPAVMVIPAAISAAFMILFLLVVLKRVVRPI